MRAGRKGKILAMPVLLCILAGCTPRESTMLLPQAEINVEEEGTAAAEDYTVKKIYTYAYDSWISLEQSAFLKECQKNEVRIIAREMQGAGETLLGRNVDYRYGFRDGEGVFCRPWEDWEEYEEGELYVEKVIPSPDGGRILAYVKSAYGDTCFVWLCEAGSEEPLLLYGGQLGESSMELRGAFSSDGRWAAFDLFGKITGKAGFVAVYDCRAERKPEIREKLEQEIRHEMDGEDGITGLYPPDRTLQVVGNDLNNPLAGEIFDVSGDVGILNMGHADKDRLWLHFYLEEDQDKDQEGQRSEMETFLDWEMGGYYPGPRYSLHKDGKSLYYLENFRRLVEVNLETGRIRGELWEFPDYVVDFALLDSGDLLVLCTRNVIEMEERKGANNSTWSGAEDFNLLEIQKRGGIQSLDLYLYSRGDKEGKLLYKNLQNLLHMEVDEATRRILLETCENGNLERRKCIVLEL